jgi:hypothetical protein
MRAISQALGSIHDAIEDYDGSIKGPVELDGFSKALAAVLRPLDEEMAFNRFWEQRASDGPVRHAPFEDRLAVQALRAALVGDPPERTKPPEIPYSSEAAWDALTSVRNGLYDYDRSKQERTDHTTLVRLVGAAGVCMDIDAAMRRIEALFPRDGSRFPVERAVPEVVDLQRRASGAGWRVSIDFDDPIDEDDARLLITRTREAHDRFTSSTLPLEQRLARFRGALEDALWLLDHPGATLSPD